jgi:hypothetical protein
VFAVFFISLWLLLWISTERSVVSAQIDQLSHRLSAQEELVKQAELDRLTRSQMQQDIQLDEKQKMQLAAARQLISRKAFSWTRLVSDIEAHTPKDARILSIKGDELSNGQHSGSSSVEIKAVGKTAAQMTEMMEALEKSGGLFVILQSGQDAVDDTGEVPFTLELVYSPSRGNAQ